MQIIFEPNASARCVYGELIDLTQLGRTEIRRASHVEPDAGGQWLSDLSAVGGPVLGPFSLRSAALAAELYWLEQNWLPKPQTASTDQPSHEPQSGLDDAVL